MRLCPICKNIIAEKKGTYIGSKNGIRMFIENSYWQVCESCGHEVRPKALEKAIKRATKTRE